MRNIMKDDVRGGQGGVISLPMHFRRPISLANQPNIEPSQVIR